jgi:hypothetical protein
MRLTGGCVGFPGWRRGRLVGGVFEVAGRGLGSFALFLEPFGDLESKSGVDLVILFAGDLARFAESSNQCFQCANWLMNGCWCRR